MTGLLPDLENSLARTPPDRHADALRRITDLFVSSGPGLTGGQIELFDAVIGRLAAAIEIRARAELSERLADLAHAPPGVVRSLAQDEIAVARPVLTRSERLSEDDLVGVALAKGRDHMLAITERPVLSEPVTDVLVSSGDRVVAHAVAGNPGARFSAGSIAALVERSRADHALQALLGAREDLPEGQLAELLAIAKEAARGRLAASLPDAHGRALDGALERSASRVEAALVAGRDYGRALAEVQAIAARGELDEAALAAFATGGALEKAVCGIALLAGLSLPAAERLFGAGESDLLLVVGKAQGWSWATLKPLLGLRDGPSDPRTLPRALEIYEGMAPATAQRVMHFLKVRETAQKDVSAVKARQIRRPNR